MAYQFADLPEEMKIEIFKFLESDELIEATLACPEWNKLISATPAIMKHLVLNVDEVLLEEIPGYFNLNYRRLMRLKRRYTSLRFHSSDEAYFEDYGDMMITMRLVRVAKRFGRNITVFTLNMVAGSDELIVRLLKHMPNIVKLRISLSCIDKHLISIAPVVMNKLKKLKVGYGCESVFRLILAPELEKLKFYYIDREEFLPNFLQASPKLQHLNTKLVNFLVVFDYPFRLKTLITNDCGEENADVERMKDFLSYQAASVETLAARFNHEKLIEIVLTKFIRLKCLGIDLSKFKVSEDLSRQLRPMRHLEVIASDYGFSSAYAIEAILGNCPELIEIDCPQDQNLPNQLDFVAKHNTKLETLRIFTINSKIGSNFQFLETLELEILESLNLPYLICFLTMNPTVEFLTIKRYECSFPWENRSIDEQKILFSLGTTNVKEFEINDRKWSCSEFLDEKRFILKEDVDIVYNGMQLPPKYFTS